MSDLTADRFPGVFNGFPKISCELGLLGQSKNIDISYSAILRDVRKCLNLASSNLHCFDFASFSSFSLQSPDDDTKLLFRSLI